MKRRGPILISIIAIASLMSLTAFGQFTSSISGTINDPDGAVISGATVIVKNTATGGEFKATSSGSGVYTVPSLGAGTYIVTVSAPGFKQAVAQDVKLDAGAPATVNVRLEVGSATESVVVQGGGEIVQTQTANISTTLNVSQISNLPLQSRNTMYFLTLLPGTNTTGGPRGSTFNGLPQSTINVTIDGTQYAGQLQQDWATASSVISARAWTRLRKSLSLRPRRGRKAPGRERSKSSSLLVPAATNITAASTSTIATLRSIPITGSITATRRITWRPQNPAATPAAHHSIRTR